MERYLFLVFAAFAAMGTGNVLAQAPAGEETTGECRLYHGGGGDRVFPEWKWNARKVAVIPHGQKAWVWLPEGCGLDPKRIRIEAPNDLLGWNLELTEWHANGVRITFKAKAGTGKVATKVVITTPARSIELEVKIGPTYDEAVTASLKADIVSLRKEAGELRAALSVVDGKSDRAVGQSDVALNVAREAKARKDVGIELLLNPMINFETPGGTGGGVGISLSGTLGRFANDKVHLGLAGSISWHRYELELLGFQNVNRDVFGHETDMLLKFKVQIQPARFIGLYLETGVGVRFFTHDDAVSMQESDTLYVRGVEGSADIHPLWGLEAGLRLYPYRWVVLGVGFHTVVSLTRQISHPSGDPHITPERAHVWNYGMIFSVGARL